jgi:hypothetical protein
VVYTRTRNNIKNKGVLYRITSRVINAWYVYTCNNDNKIWIPYRITSRVVQWGCMLWNVFMVY